MRIAEKQQGFWQFVPGAEQISLAAAVCALVFQSACAATVHPPGTQNNISVTIAPASASLFLGQSQTFQASVTGTSNAAVTWQVNGVTGGNTAFGTISVSGSYSAPGVMPASATATITAESAAVSSATASATVSLKDDIVVTVSPSTASIPAGGEQVFTANVAASGSPAAGVAWSVNGIPGGNSTVGTIAAKAGETATYAAPAVPPTPAAVTVTATSVADGAKSGSAIATITCSATGVIAPSAANVPLAQSQTLTASFCLASGATIAWDVSGIVSGNSTVGFIAASGASTALYTAPLDLPPSNPVTIHATASVVTSGSGVATAQITITSGVIVSVSPGTASVPTGQRIALTASVFGTSDATVTWSVNGVANGNAAVGEICQPGSVPCIVPTGPVAGGVDFLGPPAVPSRNPVIVVATSHADPSRMGSSAVTISGTTNGPVSVTISPPYAFLPPSSSQPDTLQFFASVMGSPNANVTWNVQSAVNGAGCSGQACGTVSASGLYTAPTSAPSPNGISLIATRQADPTKSATATVALTSGPTIETILPSSVMAGAVESFPLSVQGVDFVAGSGGSGSVILLNGASRATTCTTAGSCATALNPSDVATAGTVTVEVQNPGAPGAISNPVPFVIAPFDLSADALELTTAGPVAAGTDIIVAEPTTAAQSAPANVNFIGMFTAGSCGAQGSPLTVTRPTTGTETVDICVQGNNLDPTFSYAFTGPAGAPNASDIGVAPSVINGLFPGTIELELQISSTTLPGVRALFITTLNNDRAVATGMLEVQ